MGPYKPLRTWVDEFIPYYGNNGSLDPIAHNFWPTIFPLTFQIATKAHR